jgi:hypothetical protein
MTIPEDELEDSVEPFEEVAHSGGRITFTRDEHGKVGVRIEHVNPWALSMYQVCVSLEGKLLDVVPVSGIGPMPPYPSPSILAWVISDREGLFGRKCGRCSSYFRTDCAARVQVCPYCAVRQLNVQFTTENQGLFVDAFCRAYAEAHNRDDDYDSVVIDLDTLADELPENRPAWHYAEERQQTRHTCEYCETIFDILGDYGSCPNCGVRNWKTTLAAQISCLREDFARARETIPKTQRDERQRQWRRLVVECVSCFEALGNDMRDLMARVPATPRRRSQIRNLSFQQVGNTAKALGEWFGVALLEGIGKDDLGFLEVIYNRRHLLSHNAGRVDQEYLDNTGDDSVRLHEVVTVSSSNVAHLVDLTEKIGLRLIDEIHSMFGLPKRDGEDA